MNNPLVGCRRITKALQGKLQVPGHEFQQHRGGTGMIPTERFKHRQGFPFLFFCRQFLGLQQRPLLRR